MADSISIVLMNDKRVASIRVMDSGEPFVDLLDCPDDIRVDSSRKDIGNDSPYFACLRRNVFKKLLYAQTQLPKGLRFFVKDCFRPLHLQKKFYDRYYEKVKRENPEYGPERIESVVSMYIAPAHVAPHSTGGAIDLTLIDVSDAELDMGTRFNARPEDTDNAVYTEAANISADARRNREILKEAMESVGFVNYPTEWWHYSYGDKYWAYYFQSQASLYDFIDLPIFA